MDILKIPVVTRKTTGLLDKLPNADRFPAIAVAIHFVWYKSEEQMDEQSYPPVPLQ